MIDKKFGIMTTAALLAAVCASSVYADTNWTGAVDQDWNNPANWSNGIPVDDGVQGNAFINDAGVGVFPIISAPGTYSADVDLWIGHGGGTGRLDQRTGLLSTGDPGWMFLGQGGASANGTYNLADTSGAGGTFTGFAQGDGSLNVGGASQAGVWHIGIDGATALVNINTEGTVAAGEINTGNTGAGGITTFNIDNGTINVGQFRIGSDFWGSNVASDNDFNMSGGQVNATGEVWIGGIGVSNSQMTGGELNSGQWLAIGRNRPGTNSVFTVTGGTINAAQAGGWLVAGGFDGGAGTINASGGTINSLLSGIWIGEGGIGAANLSGIADVNSGWLRIGGNDGSVGDVSVLGSTVSVDITDLSIGLNDVGGDTTALGTLSFVADAAGISTILATGDVNLSSPDGDMLTVDLSAYTGAHVDMLLIDGTTSQGEFTGLAQNALVTTDGNANPYYIDYSTAGDVWLRTVPEPASLALLGLGGLAMITRKR